MVRTLGNFGLLCVALFLSALLFPAGVTFWILHCAFVTPRDFFVTLSKFFLRCAVAIDQLGNVVCAALFNVTLVTQHSQNLFGHEDETVSSVLGKNKVAGTLSYVGKILSSLLDWLDTNHVTKSIEN